MVSPGSADLQRCACVARCALRRSHDAAEQRKVASPIRCQRPLLRKIAARASVRDVSVCNAQLSSETPVVNVGALSNALAVAIPHATAVSDHYGTGVVSAVTMALPYIGVI